MWSQTEDLSINCFVLGNDVSPIIYICDPGAQNQS